MSKETDSLIQKLEALKEGDGKNWDVAIQSCINIVIEDASTRKDEGRLGLDEPTSSSEIPVVSEGGLHRLKMLADNDTGAWVDFHGDLWDLINFYEKSTMPVSGCPITPESLKMHQELFDMGVAHAKTEQLDGEYHVTEDGSPIFGETSKWCIKSYLEGLSRKPERQPAQPVELDDANIHLAIEILENLKIYKAYNGDDWPARQAIRILELIRNQPMRESSQAEQQIKAIKKALANEAMYDSCVDAIENILTYHPPMPVLDIEDGKDHA